MGQSLIEIAQTLKDADKEVQLIYAFNGTGKTRLSREFIELISPKNPETEEVERTLKILYYNAFTEDLFYWDNDLDNDTVRKMKIQPNNYTRWILEDQGQEPNITRHFQRYTNDKLTPTFNVRFSEVTFSFDRGNEEPAELVKISKGEESCFIWSIFYSILEQTIDVLIEQEVIKRETDQFNDLEYVFIDDPVSSLDENHLIELAVDIVRLIKKSRSKIKFVITTHNPLFFNVLHNELKEKRYKKYLLRILDDGTFELVNQADDSPFSYHLFLKSEIKRAIETGQLSKYHFNFLRNILEKTSTFLGQEKWGALLPERTPGERDAYLSRIINISSHSKHANEEVFDITENDKRVLVYLMENIKIFEFFKS